MKKQHCALKVFLTLLYAVTIIPFAAYLFLIARSIGTFVFPEHRTWLDCAAWGALACGVTLTGWWSVAVWHEPRPGRCPSCGYDRAGLAVGAACPECGGKA